MEIWAVSGRESESAGMSDMVGKKKGIVVLGSFVREASSGGDVEYTEGGNVGEVDAFTGRMHQIDVSRGGPAVVTGPCWDRRATEAVDLH